MMNESKSEGQAADIVDSETSVDYYVTTVNDKTNEKSELSSKPVEQHVAIVVSVDRAGSVKVRKRKKSKRRKKKSNLALEDLGAQTSDDAIRFQSSASDGSQQKVPRRSSSLSERDLQRNSKIPFAEMTKNGEDMSLKEGPTTETDHSVRRRVKKSGSFKINRRGMVLDNYHDISNQAQPRTRQTISEGYSKNPRKQLDDGSVTQPKKINRQDALATLNAFMMEVEEATTVAKQQEQGERRKDPSIRRSHSLNELLANETDYSMFDPNDYQLPPVDVQPAVKIPPYVHQKSESIGQHSVLSGSVFLSDPDISIEEVKAPITHLALTKTSSSENRPDKRSKSLYDLVMATDATVLTEMMCKKVSENQIPTSNRTQSQASSRKGKDNTDYGITHLEQVCKLIEQIGDLRNKNQALTRRVKELENQVHELKGKGGEYKIDTNNFDYFHSHASHKRAHPVDRIKDVISRSRKSSIDKHHSSQDPKTISQPLMLIDDAADAPLAASFPTSGFSSMAFERPVIQSGISLKKNRRRLYSRDDLDLSIRGRWKFWKAPTRNTVAEPSKRRVVSSIKAEHMQGSAVHLKSASVTLDSLLNNIDNDFSQKMIQWQSATRPSRAPSRASEVSGDTFNRTIQSSSSGALLPSSDESMRFRGNQTSFDGKPETTHKESIREKLSKWEKVAVRKISWHGDNRRSKSVDRMNISANDVDQGSTLARHRATSTGPDFYKSMPCVMTESNDSVLRQSKKNAVNTSLGSVEWSALQQAFPTTQANGGKTVQRLIGGSHSRLASPLRKKNSKRRSWSFAKRISSKYYLPNSGDFSIGSNLELAGHMGNQLTLQLDHEDVKGITSGVNDEELNYLKKNTKDLREKLKVIENEWANEPMKHQVRQRPASSMARYHAESSGSDEGDHRRSRCPFFPAIKTRRHPAPVFV